MNPAHHAEIEADEYLRREREVIARQRRMAEVQAALDRREVQVVLNKRYAQTQDRRFAAEVMAPTDFAALEDW